MQKPHALLRGLFASVDNFCGGENFYVFHSSHESYKFL